MFFFLRKCQWISENDHKVPPFADKLRDWGSGSDAVFVKARDVIEVNNLTYGGYLPDL